MASEPVTTENLLISDHARLGDLLIKVYAAIDTADQAAVFARLDLFWARLAMHIRAEHLHLFPAILTHCENTSGFSGIRDTLTGLRHDHDFFMRELSQAVRSLREGAEADMLSKIKTRLLEIEKRLNEHDQIEETDIYPFIKQMAAFSKFGSLNIQIKKDLENLPPRFKEN